MAFALQGGELIVRDSQRVEAVFRCGSLALSADRVHLRLLPFALGADPPFEQ